MAEYTQTKFDSKSFNPVAFGKYVERIPSTKQNELIRSRVLKPNAEIRAAFSSQTGTAYATIPMTGRIGGKPLNYDGQTDMTANTTTTFERGVTVVGRMNSWVEKDFSYDITGGVNFMDNVAQQIAEYWEGVDQNTLLAIIKGIFSMTGAKNLEFVNGHTYTTNSAMTATTLNSACNQACGANKKKFSLTFMHSDTSTALENLNLIERLKYTDKDGIQRDLELGTWNGKLVVVDDDMPTEEGYFDAASTDDGALKIVADSATPTAGEIKLGAVTPYFGSKTLAANDYVIKGTQYTTYVFGDGAIDYENIGAKVPYAMSRDEKTNGGEDTLYSRQRKVFAPYGISYTRKSQASLSPTDEELANGANWELVHNGESTKKEYIDHKAIPIARILSRG